MRPEISYLDMSKLKTVKYMDMTFGNVLSLLCEGF